MTPDTADNDSESHSDKEWGEFAPVPSSSLTPAIEPDDPQSDALRANPGDPEIELSPEQQRIMQMVKAGCNIFFTGSAGMFLFLILHSSYLNITPRNGKICSAS